MRAKSIALSSLFGIVIFFQKLLLPAPYDKMVSVLIQITLLSLAFLIVGFVGPILTGFISGLLTASVRGDVGLMSFAFALTYGALVSSLCRLFVVIESERIRMWRLMASSLVSTILVGFLSASTSIILGVMPSSPILVVTMIVAGAVQGIAGGYLSGLVWDKYLHNI